MSEASLQLKQIVENTTHCSGEQPELDVPLDSTSILLPPTASGIIFNEPVQVPLSEACMQTMQPSQNISSMDFKSLQEAYNKLLVSHERVLQENETLTKDNETLACEKNELLDSKKAIISEVAELRATNNNSLGIISELKVELDEKEESIQILKTKLSELELDHENLKDKNRNLTSKMRTLEFIADGVEEVQYKLCEEIKQATLCLRDEEAKVLSLQIMLDDQGHILQQNNDQIYELEEEQKALKSQIEQLTNELHTINEENRSQGNMMRRLDGARRREMGISKTLRNDIKGKVKEIERLQLMISSYQSRIMKKNRELRKAAKTNLVLEDKATMLDSANKDLEKFLHQKGRSTLGHRITNGFSRTFRNINTCFGRQ